MKLPKMPHEDVNPPSAGEVEAMVLHISRRYRLALETLAATGMRVGELYALLWRDVDAARSRFRVRDGKSAAARQVGRCAPRDDDDGVRRDAAR